MRSIISATLIAGGMALAGPVSAAPMFSFNVTDFGTDKAAAQSALSAWQGGQRVFETETFEGFESHGDGDADTVGARDPSTSVGTFTAGGAAGTGSACVPDCDTTIVKDESDPDAFGRNITADGEKWLDSNDAEQTIWDIAPGPDAGFSAFNRLAFFLIDATDVGATVNVSLADGGSDSFELSGLVDGNIQFITGSFTEKVTGATLTVENIDGPTTSDGWGIDDASVAVPTPGTLALFGMGLLGLGAAARRCRA